MYTPLHTIVYSCATDFCNTKLYLRKLLKYCRNFSFHFSQHIFFFFYLSLCVAKFTFVPNFAPTSFNGVSWCWRSLPLLLSTHFSHRSALPFPSSSQAHHFIRATFTFSVQCHQLFTVFGVANQLTAPHTYICIYIRSVARSSCYYLAEMLLWRLMRIWCINSFYLLFQAFNLEFVLMLVKRKCGEIFGD